MPYGSLLHDVLGLSAILEHGVSKTSCRGHDRSEQSLEGDLVAGCSARNQIGLAWHSHSFVTRLYASTGREGGRLAQIGSTSVLDLDWFGQADREAKPSAAWPDPLREFLNDGSEPLAIRRLIPEKSAANQSALGRQAPCLNGFDRKYPCIELEWTSLAP
jgi:hypothetical protein